MPSKRGGSTSRTTLLVQNAAECEVLSEGVRNALVSAHAAGVIRFINRWKEVLFGRDGSELVGRLAEAVVSKSVRRGHLAFRAGYLTGPRTRVMGAAVELRELRRAGTVFPLDLSSIFAEDGQLVPKRCAT